MSTSSVKFISSPHAVALLARICAAVLCGFIVLQGLGEMWVLLLRGFRGGIRGARGGGGEEPDLELGEG